MPTHVELAPADLMPVELARVELMHAELANIGEAADAGSTLKREFGSVIGVRAPGRDWTVDVGAG